MKWMFAAVAILLIGLLVAKGSDLLPAAEIKIDEHISVIAPPADAIVSDERVMLMSGAEFIPQDVVPIAQVETARLSAALCLEGRGCTLDLHENWHLKLLTKQGRVLTPELETVFKSRNFIEAAEQLHYSRQKVDDYNTELRVKEQVSVAVKRYQAYVEGVGCRDHLCLLQLSVPIETKLDDVRNLLSAPDLAWQTLSMSKQKSKLRWRLRFVAYADDKEELLRP